MIENILFLSAPITMCVLMAGVMSYFGNHILSRGLIFIDIAVAQVAALGTMIGLLLGMAEGSLQVQLVSLAFTVVVIVVFALTKFERQKIPQEAIIGIIYGLGLGLAMFFAEHIPGGSNYISKTITGNILWVTWKNVATCSSIFIVVALIHMIFGKSFVRISASKDELPYSIAKVRAFELLFYISFSLVIVKAVPIGGIFLVFTLLIAPPTIATYFTSHWGKRFLWSWIIGILGSLAGIYISYTHNLSNGPAIVCLLGIAAFALAFQRILSRNSNP